MTKLMDGYTLQDLRDMTADDMSKLTAEQLYEGGCRFGVADLVAKGELPSSALDGEATEIFATYMETKMREDALENRTLH